MPPSDIEVDVFQASEYTLSLRIEANSVDFEAMDKLMSVAGSHRHVDRRPTPSRPGQSYDQWEIEARDEGATVFDSIGEAFSALGHRDIASAVRLATATEAQEAYWWCGCFHSASPTLTVIAEETLDLLGRSRSPLLLDTYYSPGGSDDSGPSVDEDPDDIPVEPFLHRYRFRLSGGELCSTEGEWGQCFEEFSEGLEAELRELAKPARRNELASGLVKRIVCEHVQYAFDGGPRLSAAHSGAIASLGLDLEILWCTGWISSADVLRRGKAPNSSEHIINLPTPQSGLRQLRT